MCVAYLMRPMTMGAPSYFFLLVFFCRLPYFVYPNFFLLPCLPAQLCTEQPKPGDHCTIPFPTTQSPSFPPISISPYLHLSSSFIFIFIILLLTLVVLYDLNCRFELSLYSYCTYPGVFSSRRLNLIPTAHQSRSQSQSRDPCPTNNPSPRNQRRKVPISKKSFAIKVFILFCRIYETNKQKSPHRHYDGAHPSSNVCTSPWPSTSTGRR